MPRLSPPGLPPRLVDYREDTTVPVESTWDSLEKAAVALTSIYGHSGERVRVKWLRFAWVHWCCGKRMRMGCCEHQPKELTFGWEREVFNFVACYKCGRIKDNVMRLF